MSEQKKSKNFMEELDQWTTEAVIQPLMYGDPDEDPNARSWEEIADQVRRCIRQKVLESYRNGQAAGPKAHRPTRKG